TLFRSPGCESIIPFFGYIMLSYPPVSSTPVRLHHKKHPLTCVYFQGCTSLAGMFFERGVVSPPILMTDLFIPRHPAKGIPVIRENPTMVEVTRAFPLAA